MNKEVLRSQSRLDNLFGKVSYMSDDPELQAHWSRYLCVLVSGFLETSIREIFSEYTKTKASPKIVNYVERQLERFQNPNAEAILQLAGAFDPSWRSDLEDTVDEQIIAAVNSIVTNRHGIAHGRNVGLSYRVMYDYYINSRKLVELIDRQCSDSRS